MNRRSFHHTASLAALAAGLSPLRAAPPTPAPRFRHLIPAGR
jgi:hypothetical protein